MQCWAARSVDHSDVVPLAQDILVVLLLLEVTIPLVLWKRRWTRDPVLKSSGVAVILFTVAWGLRSWRTTGVSVGFDAGDIGGFSMQRMYRGELSSWGSWGVRL